MEIYPLQNYRVLDFGTAWAGPMAGVILSDMGAEVIKVESRTRLDGLRIGRPMVGDLLKGDAGQEPELQPVFHSLNRGKLSITVDFKHPKGKQLILDMVRVSDAVCHNFSPGVMERAGLGYESLRKVKPDIVMLELSGSGQYGPLRDSLTYAPVTVALGGTTSLTGYFGERPLMPQWGYGDGNAAIHGAVAMLLALYHCKCKGKGQHIDLAEVETAAALLGEAFMDYTMNRRVQATQGNRNATMAPHGNYPCKPDDKADRWVAIAIDTEEEWRGFCNAIGNPDWTKDERFADKFGRLQHRDELDSLVSQWTSGHTCSEVTEVLQKAGVAAVPVMDIEDQYFNEHLREREIFVEVEHPVVGAVTLPIVPWRLSETPIKIRRPAPTLGQHNEYVCGELLGMSKDAIQELLDEKVLQ